jgi:hypothetical protein
MRLLKNNNDRELSLNTFFGDNIPQNMLYSRTHGKRRRLPLKICEIVPVRRRLAIIRSGSAEELEEGKAERKDSRNTDMVMDTRQDNLLFPRPAPLKE